MVSTRVPDYLSVALAFASALASRDYPAAYAMTSNDYQRSVTLDHMRARFEVIVPTDWPTAGPIEVGQVMDTWPGKQPSDVGWAYISIGGDVFSEALIVVVMLESGTLKVRSVEFGRP